MILDEILRTTAERVAQITNLKDIEPSFQHKSLREAILSIRKRNAVIAELKYASPLTGSIRIKGDPNMIAKDLIAGGCTALSVLTEPSFFKGSVEMLKKVRRISPVPILRKDFIIDERQVYETRAIRADAILLIARILGEKLPSFVDLSLELGLEPLVEVHSFEEVERALASGAGLIGINNRDLGTMETDLDTTRRLSPHLRRRGRLIVSMSGIRTADDVRYLAGSCDAFLIGSAIMRSTSPQQCLEGFVFA